VRARTARRDHAPQVTRERNGAGPHGAAQAGAPLLLHRNMQPRRAGVAADAADAAERKAAAPKAVLLLLLLRCCCCCCWRGRSCVGSRWRRAHDDVQAARLRGRRSVMPLSAVARVVRVVSARAVSCYGCPRAGTARDHTARGGAALFGLGTVRTFVRGKRSAAGHVATCHGACAPRGLSAARAPRPPAPPALLLWCAWAPAELPARRFRRQCAAAATNAGASPQRRRSRARALQTTPRCWRRRRRPRPPSGQTPPAGGGGAAVVPAPTQEHVRIMSAPTARDSFPSRNRASSSRAAVACPPLRDEEHSRLRRRCSGAARVLQQLRPAASAWGRFVGLYTQCALVVTCSPWRHHQRAHVPVQGGGAKLNIRTFAHAAGAHASM
jgi:hypothetical protein